MYTFLGFLVLITVFGSAWFLGYSPNWLFDIPQPEPPQKRITNFDECVAAGNPVMESYPEQCRTEDGKTFTREIGNELEKRDLIRIENPHPNQEIQSPLEITGEARGTWYFEASFPITLEDNDGNIIAERYAEAQDEWMTEAFVPFKAELEFGTTTAKTGWLILKKDNPSGLPEHDDALRVPVKFAP